jgi:putative endonuclease
VEYTFFITFDIGFLVQNFLIMYQKNHHYSVYFLTNPSRSTIYTGVTNDISARLVEHWKNRNNPKTFSGKYHCYDLVYREEFRNIEDAIAREKQIKGWRRSKKNALIEKVNPGWVSLNQLICGKWPPFDLIERY